MNLDITEEEREFLERVCHRAEIFARMNIARPHPFDKYTESIRRLKNKLRALDSNLINKAINGHNLHN